MQGQLTAEIRSKTGPDQKIQRSEFYCFAAVWMSDALGIVPNCQNSILEWFRAQNRMDGYKEEGSSSQDRQSNPTVHEVGEGSSQAEEGFPHAAFSITGTASPGTLFGGMQSMVPNPMYANTGLHPGFEGTQGQFGVSQGNLGMAGFSIPPVNMTPRHQHVTGQGVQMAPTGVSIMHTISFDNLESMDKPKSYDSQKIARIIGIRAQLSAGELDRGELSEEAFGTWGLCSDQFWSCYAAKILLDRCYAAGYRMDGYKEEGSSSQDRQSNPTVHEVGEGSSQAEEGFPHAAFSITGTASPGTLFGGMQSMVPNPMYANTGLHPGFEGTQGQFGVSQGNLGMAGFSIPPVNMTPRHQHVTGQGVQMAPTGVSIMHTISFDNLESMDKPKSYDSQKIARIIGIRAQLSAEGNCQRKPLVLGDCVQINFGAVMLPKFSSTGVMLLDTGLNP
ncbi:hypothetical protein L7F22_038348 [Adiantum nelumboides]|nr:hypothetical protein [Adiantum nelumboides]